MGPAWKFGLKNEDLSNKLHDQYNTYLAPIQSPEAFFHDIYEIARTAHSAAEFHHLAHGRRQQRLNELNDALESASFEIIGNPNLIETRQQQSRVSPDVMAGTSLWDYIFMRTSIFVLHLIAPLSIVVSLALSLAPLPFPIPWLLKAWFILEALFYIVIYLPLNSHLQKPANHPAAPCRADRQRLFQQCHDNIPDAGQYLRRWFRDAPEHEIKRENVKDFFRWGFLNMEHCDSTYDDELEEYIEKLEDLLGKRLEPGRGDAKCLRMTLDKVEMLHRSLTWYLLSPKINLPILHHFSAPASKSNYALQISRRGAHLLAPATYVKNKATHSLHPWHRPDSADGDVGIIAVEILSVSSRITGSAMLKEEMCEEIHRILSSHGWGNCVLVSHSYGSVVAAQLLRNPKTSISIGPVMFIDPVSFLLHLPDVAYNFICRRPSETKEHLLSYFGSKDIGIAHTLFRRFFWADNLLWKEDLQDRPTSVALASRDSIIDTKSIQAYLVGSKDWAQNPDKDTGESLSNGKLDVIWFEGLDHGQALDHKTTRLRLVEAVRAFSNETASPRVVNRRNGMLYQHQNRKR
ncbi:ribose-phosphate pyrophosphokinase [Fusarium sp. NRRL 52700]|nr:ribose-phosphate pyrophosphokinase [Fusarium sp. NRRL 52700]